MTRDRRERRIRRRRALPRVAAGGESASDDRGRCAARVRCLRSLDGDARWPVARITSRIPEGATSRHFPVNGNEAESRRLSRFFAFGHTAGPHRRTRDRSSAPNSRTRSTCAGADLIDAADDRGVGSDGGGVSTRRRVFDEMMAPDGTLRPHWRTFIDGLDRDGRRGSSARSGNRRAHAARKRRDVRRARHEGDIRAAMAARHAAADAWRRQSGMPSKSD